MECRSLSDDGTGRNRVCHPRRRSPRSTTEFEPGEGREDIPEEADAEGVPHTFSSRKTGTGVTVPGRHSLPCVTGLRWGEATGLRVEHVDSKRRRVRVEENAVLVGSHVGVGTPKTRERRVVPYPVFLDEAIRRATRDKPHSALPGPAIEGGYLRQGMPGMVGSQRVCAAYGRPTR